ncbi:MULTISPECIES: hypothetical protein [Streptomyces]|uniref:hypothetical protein n=1 Tax=Streptomyces TaxID=1883 RepID=UPI0031D544B1
MYDLDAVKNRFSARLWLWSECADKSQDPLPTASFTNADDPKKSDPLLSTRAGRARDLVRIEGSFRQRWDERAFPFDKHRLQMLVTAGDDMRHFAFTVGDDSAYNPAIAPPGWRVTGYRVVAAPHRYPTGFGEFGSASDGGSTFSRVRVEVDVVRTDPTVFWKLTGPLYLVLLMATATFLLPSHSNELGMAERLDALQSRLGVLGGGLLVVMLNMQQVNSVVTSADGLTLVDGLHLLTLIYLLVAVIGTVLAWRWTVHGGDPAVAERFHHRGALVAFVLYVLTAGAMVGYVALTG